MEPGAATSPEMQEAHADIPVVAANVFTGHKDDMLEPAIANDPTGLTKQTDKPLTLVKVPAAQSVGCVAPEVGT